VPLLLVFLRKGGKRLLWDECWYGLRFMKGSFKEVLESLLAFTRDSLGNGSGDLLADRSNDVKHRVHLLEAVFLQVTFPTYSSIGGLN